MDSRSSVQNAPPGVAIAGKYFSRRGERLYLQAIRLIDAEPPADFAAKVALRTRLLDLRRSNVNAALVPCASEATLEALAAADLSIFLELKLSGPALLNSAASTASSRSLTTLIKRLGNYPGVIGFLIDLDSVEQISAAHAADRFAHRLAKLLRALKSASDGLPIGLRHQDLTQVPVSEQEDFVWGAIGEPAAEQMAAQIATLNNVARNRPLVVEIIHLADPERRISTAYDGGAAAVLAPPLRTKSVLSWFQPKSVQSVDLPPFGCSPRGGPRPLSDPPNVSAVICVNDTRAHVERCLQSIAALDYPRLETIVVHDGSAIAGELADRFEGVHFIRRGSGDPCNPAADRNLGARAAHGEIIVFTGSDCALDRDWLRLLVKTMVAGRMDLCGGPVLTPSQESSHLAACAAAAPAAFPPIILGSRRAEYLPAANLAVRREAMVRLGGFDSRLGAGGDAVDFCWRAAEAGMRIGYCPAAAVWRETRGSFAAYLKNQFIGGRSEALLCEKHPERADILGRIVWHGVIPSPRFKPGPTSPRPGDKPRPGQGLMQSLEWNLLALAVLAASIFAGVCALPALAMLAVSPLQALTRGLRMRLDPRHDRFSCRLLLCILAYYGPLAHGAGRMSYGLSRTAARIAAAGRWSRRLGCNYAPLLARRKTAATKQLRHRF